MPIASLLLALLCAVPPSEEPRTFERNIAGETARLELAAPLARLSAASEAAFAALARGAGEPGQADDGKACDAALAALAAAGAPAALVTFRGAAAAGDPPPGAPGWAVQVGCGTPGYPLALVPLAHAGLGRSTAASDPLRVSVIAAGAAEAGRLAAQVRALGRRAGRALVEGTPGALLLLEDSRFRPLFDGRTLAGWTETGGPYDGDAAWSVEDGDITGRTGPAGEGGLLYTEQRFASFELELEADVDFPFDSGIFVRMEPGLKGAQVTLDNRPDGEIGGLFSDGWLLHRPEVKERYRQGRFNHFEVRVTDFDLRVEVWMNGEPVADYTLPPDASGYAGAGRIGLQVHGGDAAAGAARFRSVRVRELPMFGEELRAEDGWEPLLDGPLEPRWELHGALEGLRLADGVLTLPVEGEGHLATAEDFEDFELRLDFELGRLSNGGVFLRAARDGSDPAFSGAEIQILDDFGWEQASGGKLKPWQKTGSLYGAVPAGESGLRPSGEWNSYEILCRGARLAVALNGRPLYDVDTRALAPEHGPPFAERAPRGFIGLQAHSPAASAGASALVLRDLRVRRL